MKQLPKNNDIETALLVSKFNENELTNSTVWSRNSYLGYCLTFLSLMVYISSIVIGLIGCLTNYIDFVTKCEVYFVLIGVSGYGMVQTFVQAAVTVKSSNSNNNNNNTKKKTNNTAGHANTVPIIFTDVDSLVLGAETSPPARHSQVQMEIITPEQTIPGASSQTPPQALPKASTQEYVPPPSTKNIVTTKMDEIKETETILMVNDHSGGSQQHQDPQSTIIGNFIASPVSCR